MSFANKYLQNPVFPPFQWGQMWIIQELKEYYSTKKKETDLKSVSILI